MKRKPRNKMNKKVDTLKPVTIEQLGTKDDPCFGKHYKISAPECQRCGDCELCAIVTGQKNHLRRQKMEEKGTFKDLEEPKIVNRKEVRKKIISRVLELVAAAPKGVKYDVVYDDIRGAFSRYGFSMEKLKIILNKTIKRNSLTQKNGKIWKQ